MQRETEKQKKRKRKRVREREKIQIQSLSQKSSQTKHEKNNQLSRKKTTRIVCEHNCRRTPEMEERENPKPSIITLTHLEE